MFSDAPPDDWAAYRRYQYLLFRLLFYLAIGYLIYLCLSQAKGVLSMIFVSLMAAYVLDPVVDWFEARKINRTTAIISLVVVVVGFTMLFLAWMVPVIVSEFAQVGERIHAVVTQDSAVLIAWFTETTGVEVSEETMREVQQKVKEYTPQVLAYVGGFLKATAARSMGVVGWLLNVIMIPVFVFYFLRDFDKMKAWVADYLPHKYKKTIVDRATKVDTVVGDWLRGQVEVACILAVMYAIGLWLVGIKLAIPIGILAGLLNVVPYLGFAFGFSLAMLMVLLEWTGIGALAGVAAVFIIAQVLEGYVLTPKIVGEKVGLSPVTVLLVLLLGGELLGLLGFLLAVPTAGAVKTILVEALDWYRTSEHYLGSKPAQEGST